MSTISLQILLIAGSAEHPSRILANLETLAKDLQDLGASTSLWDLAYDTLPLFSAHDSLDPSASSYEAVRRLAQLADQADAFVWGSPVYHNSFSGILKNALDSLSIQQFRHKPVALVSCGNSDRTGSQPCDHLRIVARGLLAVATPSQLVTLSEDFTRVQGRYGLANHALRERCRRVAEELVAYASVMRLLRAVPGAPPPSLATYADILR